MGQFDRIEKINIDENALDEGESGEEDIYEESNSEQEQDHKKAQAVGIYKAKLELLNTENIALKSLSQHRIQYSWAIFVLVSLFILASFVVAYMYGSGHLDKLDTSIIITIFTTNMVQLVGVLYIVAKWLYPAKK